MLSSDPSKNQPKYKCSVSGEKRMTPCAGCPSTQNCMSRSMQYKENEEMEEKAVVKIGADGSPVSCAKGDMGGCGYKAGAKVCGKCGAMAVQVKKNDTDEEDTEAPDAEMTEGEETETLDVESDDMNPMPDMGMEDVAEGTDYMDGEEDGKKKKYHDVEGEPDSVWRDREKLKKARRGRLNSMGIKSEDVDDEAYVCGIERKMLPGNTEPCAGCTGGCAPEADLPTLLEIEGIAEDTFGGKVLTSGYSDLADMFLVDLQRKDGRTFEVLFDGVTAEPIQWTLLRKEDGISEKSLEGNQIHYIGFDEAVDIAVKSVEGNVLAVDVDTHEGYDVYAVAIDGVDGKAYDVFLSVDGEVLDIAQYEGTVTQEKSAEEAEAELKAEYSEEQRTSMADSGEALDDGSFPIKNTADLQNAIQAFGRASDKAKAKAHIMKRARELEAEDMIPANWTEKSEEHDFMATLMEFEVLAAEEDI